MQNPAPRAVVLAKPLQIGKFPSRLSDSTVRISAVAAWAANSGHACGIRRARCGSDLAHSSFGIIDCDALAPRDGSILLSVVPREVPPLGISRGTTENPSLTLSFLLMATGSGRCRHSTITRGISGEEVW
ncbi:hypothetical protein SD37_09290 [Amycolatopsis orientalis]|uniref:Uncharacterized protein n=1 Tax=Amycolatopsis orientalis TaxID=31958 RepID=A0A193BUH2_AMYOR|nr:hypothetical protein SD37_09290 [Amycolatopsis orientalis]